MLAEHHPLISLLVLADPVDGQFIQDLYEGGACGVLWKPFGFEPTHKLIRTADEATRERRLWQEEYEKSGTPALRRC